MILRFVRNVVEDGMYWKQDRLRLTGYWDGYKKELSAGDLLIGGKSI